MSSSERASASSVLGPLAGGLTIAIVLTAAGCSADVTRFSLGGFGTTGAIPPPFASTAAPAPDLALQESALPPVAAREDYRVVGRDYGPPPDRRPPSARRPSFASRPPLDSRPPPASRWTPPASRPQFASRTPPDSRPPPASHTPVFEPPAPEARPSQSVEVQAGDTLYSIARRHGVPASAIKELNGLPSTTIRPGQRLVLPGEAKDRRQPAETSPPPGDGTGAKLSDTAEASPPGWAGRYVVKSGDSLSGIALRYNVSVEELARVNGIADPTKMWAGAELMVPAGAADPVANPAPALPPRIVQVKPRIIRGSTGEPDAAPPQRTAKRRDLTNDALPPPAVASGKFRWPVRGRVIVGFGPQPDGTKNEGINLAAPLGTDVHAAEAGRVHYVGDGLKSYGNLVLVRHANDWATAYGHLDQILVKANDEVKRGQVIGKVGTSGPVTRPQLKFELRKDSLPVDPLAHLGN